MSLHDGTRHLSNKKGSAAFFRAYLIDVRDEFTLSRHVDFLIVRSHLALDRKEENLQISLLCKPEKITTTLLIRKYSVLWFQLNIKHVISCVSLLQLPVTHLGGFSTVL